LLIERVQLTAHRSSGPFWVPRHPLPVKRLLFPSAGVAGEDLAGFPPPRSHLN
jgi:hypothetical protein